MNKIIKAVVVGFVCVGSVFAVEAKRTYADFDAAAGVCRSLRLIEAQAARLAAALDAPGAVCLLS
jgi:hypothetical protein